jgi:hypothetical protein
MFDIRPLATPETIAIPGGSVTLTHQMEVLHINPRNTVASLEVRAMKGFLGADGNFIDYGAHQVSTLDATGFAALLADTTGGKHAGDFRLSDIAPAITARQAAKDAAAKAAADAQAKAQKP